MFFSALPNFNLWKYEFLMERFISVVTLMLIFFAVIYDGCPKTITQGIWWPRTKFNLPAAVPCPKGSVGVFTHSSVPCWLVQAWANFLKRLIFFTGAAIRHCDVERGWLEPDLYNCTSPPFVELNIAVRCSAVTEGLSCFFIIFCPLRLI